jgi:hypothetical protein
MSVLLAVLLLLLLLFRDRDHAEAFVLVYSWRKQALHIKEAGAAGGSTCVFQQEATRVVLFHAESLVRFFCICATAACATLAWDAVGHDARAHKNIGAGHADVCNQAIHLYTVQGSCYSCWGCGVQRLAVLLQLL